MLWCKKLALFLQLTQVFMVRKMLFKSTSSLFILTSKYGITIILIHAALWRFATGCPKNVHMICWKDKLKPALMPRLSDIPLSECFMLYQKAHFGVRRIYKGVMNLHCKSRPCQFERWITQHDTLFKTRTKRAEVGRGFHTGLSPCRLEFMTMGCQSVGGWCSSSHHVLWR